MTCPSCSILTLRYIIDDWLTMCSQACRRTVPPWEEEWPQSGMDIDRNQLCLHIKTFNFVRLAMSGSKFVLEGNEGKKYDSESLGVVLGAQTNCYR